MIKTCSKCNRIYVLKDCECVRNTKIDKTIRFIKKQEIRRGNLAHRARGGEHE